MNNKENHEKFLKHLERSTEAVMVVAKWLVDNGVTVQIPGVEKAPNHKNWKEFADDGDLYLVYEEGKKRLEVKRLSVHFTNSHDWPFGNQFIVCAKHSYVMADIKPEGYVIINNNMTHAAIVKSESFERWRVEQKTDSRYEGVSQEFYFCPMDVVEWKTLN